MATLRVHPGKTNSIKHRGRVIGKAGAWCLPAVGFLLHPDHGGKGLAQQAMAAVSAHLSAAHAVPDLTAETDPRNAASLGLLGFVETGPGARVMNGATAFILRCGDPRRAPKAARQSLAVRKS